MYSFSEDAMTGATGTVEMEIRATHAWDDAFLWLPPPGPCHGPRLPPVPQQGRGFRPRIRLEAARRPRGYQGERWK